MCAGLCVTAVWTAWIVLVQAKISKHGISNAVTTCPDQFENDGGCDNNLLTCPVGTDLADCGTSDSPQLLAAVCHGAVLSACAYVTMHD